MVWDVYGVTLVLLGSKTLPQIARVAVREKLRVRGTG
jgi:hypothetical protein